MTGKPSSEDNSAVAHPAQKVSSCVDATPFPACWLVKVQRPIYATTYCRLREREEGLHRSPQPIQSTQSNAGELRMAPHHEGNSETTNFTLNNHITGRRRQEWVMCQCEN